MSWLSSAFRAIERLFRRRVLNPAKQTVAQELSANLNRIDDVVKGAVLKYANGLGGTPLSYFVSVAFDSLGLSSAASMFLRGLLGQISAGASRAVETSRVEEDWENAGMEEVTPVLAAIRAKAAERSS